MPPAPLAVGVFPARWHRRDHVRRCLSWIFNRCLELKEIEGIMSGEAGGFFRRNNERDNIKGSCRRGWGLGELFRRSLEKWRKMIASGED